MIDSAKFFLLCFYLVVISIIVIFNLLYAGRALKANKEIGLYAPKYIQVLVKVSTGIALVTALLIAVFLVVQLY